MSATARRVDDDFGVASGERVDVVARELARTLPLTRMRMERAAAGLLARRRHDMSITLEDAHRRALRIAEGLAHHAAGEHRDVRALALPRDERRTFTWRRERRRPADSAAQLRRELDQTGLASERGEPREHRQPSHARDGVEGDAGGQADPRRPLAMAYLLARTLHDPAERHARRAGRFARAANETGLEVLASP